MVIDNLFTALYRGVEGREREGLKRIHRTGSIYLYSSSGVYIDVYTVALGCIYTYIR